MPLLFSMSHVIASNPGQHHSPSPSRPCRAIRTAVRCGRARVPGFQTCPLLPQGTLEVSRGDAIGGRKHLHSLCSPPHRSLRHGSPPGGGGDVGLQGGPSLPGHSQQLKPLYQWLSGPQVIWARLSRWHPVCMHPIITSLMKADVGVVVAHQPGLILLGILAIGVRKVINS